MKNYRLLLAVITTVLMGFSSMQAAPLRPLVVVGIPGERLAVTHPAPFYPWYAWQMGIEGDVVIEVNVASGKVLNARVLSGRSLLGRPTVRFVQDHWQFKPQVSGSFQIPISYKLRA
jgi:TonB family protein